MTPIKIGFVLSSNSRNPLPSTRISVLNMIPFLRAAGFDPHIVFEPESGMQQPELPGLAERLVAQQFEIVLFQKVCGPHVETVAHRLRNAGIKTVFGVCDIVDAAMAQATDATVTVTSYLRSLYPAPLHPKIHVVHDGIENPAACKTEWSANEGSPKRPLRAVLVTSASLTRLPVIETPPPWLQVVIVGDYPPTSHYVRRMKEVRWTILDQRRKERVDYLGFLFDRRIRCLPWDSVGVYRHIAEADIGIIPVDMHSEQPVPGSVPNWMVKSENRMTMKMSMALPVIASPVPSYEPVVEHGVNGFLAQSRGEWFSHLDALRDPALRRQVGQRARAAVCDRYSMGEQARRLIDVFRGLLQPDATGSIQQPSR